MYHETIGIYLRKRLLIAWAERGNIPDAHDTQHANFAAIPRHSHLHSTRRNYTHVRIGIVLTCVPPFENMQSLLRRRPIPSKAQEARETNEAAAPVSSPASNLGTNDDTIRTQKRICLEGIRASALVDTNSAPHKSPAAVALLGTLDSDC